MGPIIPLGEPFPEDAAAMGRIYPGGCATAGLGGGAGRGGAGAPVPRPLLSWERRREGGDMPWVSSAGTPGPVHPPTQFPSES